MSCALGKGLSNLNPAFVSEKDRWERVDIEDIPFMVSDEGAIVCIPKEFEVFALGICGMSGNGKSLCLNHLVTELFHHQKNNVCILNDVQEETYKWSEPMDDYQFNKSNEETLNQKPVASPIVYVYQNTNTLKLNTNYLESERKNYLKTVLPFNEIIEDIGFYLAGVNPEFELGKSETYLMNLQEDLIGCDTSHQVREILEENLPGGDGKTFQSMRVKIFTAFENLFKEEILNITNPECHSYLRIRLPTGTKNSAPDYVSNPFSVLMKAGIIPSFVTSDLANKKYKSAIFSYYINSIFHNNLEDFPGEKTFMVFDELRDVCENDTEPAAKAMGQVGAKGRMNNVGLVYCTQFYDRIPKCVKGAKLNYLFAFTHNSSDIITEIGKDFDLDRKTRDKLKHLRKFEIIAMTSNHFVCYRDGEKWTETRPLKGKILFPLSGHSVAGKGGKTI